MRLPPNSRLLSVPIRPGRWPSKFSPMSWPQCSRASCRLIERADRSGAFRVDGAASTAAYVRQVSGQTGAWASKRVQVGRTLADRMPVTAKAWEAGELGLDHAWVIQQATRDLDDTDLAAELEGFLAPLRVCSQQAAPSSTHRRP
jgi:hypothetical protein